MARIEQHPIVQLERGEPFRFSFNGAELEAYPGEVISTALFAHGIRIFGHHPKDHAPQGIYCANGQCSQCMVLADGRPVKACMTEVRPGMKVEPLDGLPKLPNVSSLEGSGNVETIDVEVLILGGGPSGLSAAVELGSRGVDVLLVDDKDRLGGKLVLQTHRFFGSVNAVYAGTRGIDIATRLENSVREQESVRVWLNSTALAVFSDRVVGVLHEDCYVLVRPKVLLVATGAREKSLVFPGNTLPGVYGAGAFQTLVNRDLVRASERLFIVGGGNVGLIAGYHALQAGIDVVGLVEAMPECGGYKVHRDKLARMGVPIYTSHTILGARGDEGVESVTIAEIDKDFQPIAGTERSFACDTVLIAVGLDPVDEFTDAARAYGMEVYAAGDAEEIAEASAAIFSGKIRGLEIARALDATQDEIPADWAKMAEILKSKPGAVLDRNGEHTSVKDQSQEFRHGETPKKHGNDTSSGGAFLESSGAAEFLGGVHFEGVFPVFHCSQEIPCNPCTSVCPQGLIHIDESDIRHLPEFVGETVGKACVGCEKCVMICPGLAITLVDARGDAEHPTVTIPFEYKPDRLTEGDRVLVLDAVGELLGEVPIVGVKALPRNDRTVLIKVKAPAAISRKIAGIRVQEAWVAESLPEAVEPLRDEDIVCRCERVTAGEIRAQIRKGIRDINEIKAVTRAGMGACGGKTCSSLILRLFREQGVSLSEVTANVPRPLFVEVPLGTFAALDASSKGGE